MYRLYNLEFSLFILTACRLLDPNNAEQGNTDRCYDDALHTASRVFHLRYKQAHRVEPRWLDRLFMSVSHVQGRFFLQAV